MIKKEIKKQVVTEEYANGDKRHYVIFKNIYWLSRKIKFVFVHKDPLLFSDYEKACSHAAMLIRPSTLCKNNDCSHYNVYKLHTKYDNEIKSKIKTLRCLNKNTKLCNCIFAETHSNMEPIYFYRYNNDNGPNIYAYSVVKIVDGYLARIDSCAALAMQNKRKSELSKTLVTTTFNDVEDTEEIKSCTNHIDNSLDNARNKIVKDELKRTAEYMNMLKKLIK